MTGRTLQALLDAALRYQAKIVYLANPDNPMGSWWPAEDVERFTAALPPTTLLLLDEAYGELAPAGTLPPLDTSRPNVLRLRTFSKAYGLAGLRCGYAVGERRHYPGLRAGAQSFRRQQHRPELLPWRRWPTRIICGPRSSRVETARQRIAEIALDNGLVPLPSATNFVTIDCGRDGDYAMRAVAGDGRTGRIPAQADGGRARPLHSRHRRTGSGVGDFRPGLARGAGAAIGRRMMPMRATSPR